MPFLAKRRRGAHEEGGAGPAVPQSNAKTKTKLRKFLNQEKRRLLAVSVFLVKKSACVKEVCDTTRGASSVNQASETQRAAHPAWRTQHGVPGVAYPAWRTRCGVPGVAYPAWRTRRGAPSMAYPAWRTRCGVPGVAYPVWRTQRGVPSVAYPV